MSLAKEMLIGLYAPIKRRIQEKKKESKLLVSGHGRNLYQTQYGDRFWLNETSCVDKSIIDTGIWESKSTDIVKKLVKKGDVVLDVGANIGYYTVIISKIVGNEGKVIAFEPTKYFGDVLEKNIYENEVKNCIVQKYALSDEDSITEIIIGENSATINWISDCENTKRGSESIETKRLDDIISDLNLHKIDFIKIDVDGHEPAFFRGAIESIHKFKPTILMEIAHLNYLQAGTTAWDFYDYLKKNGMHIYFEDDLSECTSKTDFLIRCGNFAYSANIVVTEKGL